ncbi:MAG: hypothetical protein NTU67_02040 [Gemmatimonadetes bacterium]|nr:hypothetical protein [Gemmatimonadota bacterium]
MKSAATSASVAAPLRISAPLPRQRRGWSALLLIFLVGVVGACAENIDTGKGCPVLCAGQSLTVRDTVITPVLVFDSTYVGYPQRGTETGLLLASRGDTIETRGIVRFDSMLTAFAPPNDTTRLVTQVDSSKLRLVFSSLGRRLSSKVTFDIYDVDEPSDTNSAAVLANFVANRRIGGKTVDSAAFTDTTYIPLADSAVLDKIKNGKHLRVGIKISGTGSVWLRAGSMETGYPATVSYKPSKDTLVKALVVSPISSVPIDPAEVKRDLQDYTLVAKYNIVPTTGTFAVGGTPGRRAYLRFNIPRYISDSATVIRATLRLTQRPVKLGSLRDSIVVHAHVGLAGPTVTDLFRASDIISIAGLLVLDSLIVSPADSGLKTLEMYTLVRAWGGQSALVNQPPRALILKARDEFLSPMEVRFFSTSGPLATRPSLRVTYVPKSTYGVP